MIRVAIFLLLLFCSCTYTSPSDLIEADNESQLNLKWNKAYPEDTIDKSMLGLEWAFSFLGAMLPNSPSGIEVGTDKIVIEISQLGLNENAYSRLFQLHQNIKSSDEYQKTNAIDLGRYITLLIGAPEHYYRIAGVPTRLEDLIAQYELGPEMGYVNDSGVSDENRIIRFSEQNNLNQLFVSSEVDPDSGEIYEYETIEIQPNGQLRFGIFDNNGNRINNADTSHSRAGKPAKCMWCHESNILRMFSLQNDYPGYLTYLQFQGKLLDYNQYLNNQQLLLANGVDFSDTQAHTLTELLYISFMEPSAARLSLEWNMPLNEVQQLLQGIPTHTYDEFLFLGNLYHRAEIQSLAPFVGLPVSSSVREQSTVEVNYLE